MQIACLIFVNLIALANLVVGARQLLRLIRLKVATAAGTITSSGLGEPQAWPAANSKVQMFWPEIRYCFHYAGRMFESNSISLIKTASSEPQDFQPLLGQFPVGASVTVFLNAAKPEESYLTDPRKHRWSTLWILLSVIAVCCFANWAVLTFVP